MKTLERVHLDHLARRYPHEISGGEQQRAAIARAIVNQPAIVLADEPTGNLDPRASEEVMKILRWINASGTTVVMATHDRAIVDQTRRRVVQLHKGQLVRDEEHGSYDPPEGSPAWEVLSAELEESGLQASDPMPLLTQTVPTVAQNQTDEPEVEEDPGFRVREYQVTFPEDDPSTTTPSLKNPEPRWMPQQYLNSTTTSPPDTLEPVDQPRRCPPQKTPRNLNATRYRVHGHQRRSPPMRTPNAPQISSGPLSRGDLRQEEAMSQLMYQLGRPSAPCART